jgi:hypothetical protein
MIVDQRWWKISFSPAQQVRSITGIRLRDPDFHRFAHDNYIAEKNILISCPQFLGFRF